MSKNSPKTISIDGKGIRFGIVAARYNESLVNELLSNLMETLTAAGVEQEDIRLVRVPGSSEIPYAASMLANTEAYDCVICLGVVIAGETPHHEIIGSSTGNALQKIAIENEIPVINGVIVVNNLQQAEDRCSGGLNRGEEFARAALEMGQLSQELSSEIPSIDEMLDSLTELDERIDGMSSLESWDDDDDDFGDDSGDSWKK
jgi:6,7-dimethyl-8-ribityllumazine synthase